VQHENASTTEPSVAPETLIVRASDDASRSVTPPIFPSTTYHREPDLSYPTGRGYTRDDNPTYDEPEALLAALEGGEAAALFASGLAASTAVFCALGTGDHVVVPKVMYWGLRAWLQSAGVRWGLDITEVDVTRPEEVAAAVRPGRTRLVWVETPANPTWDVVDIEAVAAIAHAAGAALAVDSTSATPVLTRPVEHGADLVVHSATKYLNGHSDVLAGAVVCARADELWERVLAWRHDAGAVPGPFEAWLLLRGMRTLFLRVRRQSESALALASALEGHPAVAAVLYPGLPAHPGHAVAARQMQGGFGGMLSIRVRGGEAAAVAVAAGVQVFTRATSLGGVESLIEHRASVEGPTSPVPADLLRISVGIEEPADLLADLRQALDRLV
jgi:cystathionine gamma-synthase